MSELCRTLAPLGILHIIIALRSSKSRRNLLNCVYSYYNNIAALVWHIENIIMDYNMISIVPGVPEHVLSSKLIIADS